MTKLLCAVFVVFVSTLAPLDAAALRISEFLAENDGGLIDSDGDTPDWIEIENTAASAVNLAGWRLTDNPTNLTKWTFPPTNLAANGYLLVFASGKDRATNGAPLHTNFRLENGGGYLALVDSNGVVASEFHYPQQHRNVSFGPSSSNAPPVSFLTSGAATRWLVPTNGALGTTWTAPGFDASAWSNASTPLRFDPGAGVVGAPVLSVDFNANTAGSTDTNPPANTEVGFDTMALNSNPRTFNGITVQLSALSGGVLDSRDRTTPTQSGSLTLDQIYDDFIFVIGQTNGNGARIQITGLIPDQNYQLKMWSFDSMSLGARMSDWTETASGAARVITNGYTFDGSVLPTSDDQYTFGGLVTASAGGALSIEGRRSGGTSHGVFMNALQLAPVNSVTATGNVAAMFGVNASLYTRTEFNVASTNGLNSVTLRVRYNDGFVAYLNGTEVARRNAPAMADWNSAATAPHSSGVTEDIVLPGAAALALEGNNVLAIHGLNVSTTNTDFFLEPQLIATYALAATNGFYSPATPGTANGVSYFGVVADTKFSVDRGFYDAPFSLTITSATPGAAIYFTTNGGVPSPTNGFLHSAPIGISANSFIRAAAYLQGWIPSGIDTHSYIFLRDVLRQSNNIPGYPTNWQASYPADYAMDPNIVNHPVYGATISNDLRSIPSLMIVSDHNGLWGQSTGIYPNSTSTGDAWDRAASLELIDGSGQTEFATTAKIAMHGNASRDNVRTPKHSMRASFNSDYGPTKLRYDWFGGGVEVHNGIVFRSCGFVDGWAGRYADNGIYTSTETGESFRGLRYRPENTCYLRDAWVKDSFRDMGWHASRSAYVHLYINGLYWGLYEPSERLNSSYFAQHLGGNEGAWDVVVGEDNNGPPVLVDGSLTDWNAVLALVNAGITNEAAYQAVAAVVDLDNLIDYMLVHIFAESEDWPRHNWYVAHRRATNGIPGTKFICSVWDQELTLDRLVRRDRVNVGSSGGEIYSPARVYQQLRAWPEFRVRFGDRVHQHLFNGGALTPSNNVARLLGPAAIIRDAIVGESARWGDARSNGVPAGQIGTGKTFTRDEWWQPEIDKTATNFFQKLTADNVARFRANALYPGVGAPEFSQFGGAVSNGFQLVITHTNATGVIYFTVDGSDPRAYGSGAVGAGAQAYATPVPINSPALVRARVLQGANWSALVEAVFYPPQDLTGLVITELMYNPLPLGATNGDDFEFIELRNNGTNAMNLSGLTFTDGISFTFSNGTMLSTGQFFVIARNAAAFASRYGGPPDGSYTGRLDNGGERITLSHPLGGNLFTFVYDDVAPWPAAADGYGFSIQPRDPFTIKVPDDGAKWRASTLVHGTPWGFEPASALPQTVINEILTHTDLPAVDRIELFNPEPFVAQIGGWFLTDDVSVPKKFRIPDGTTIAPFGFVTFDESQFNATPGTNNSFSLSSSGESVYLFSGDANTNLTGYSHGVAFGAAANGVSFGRHVNSAGEEQFPAQISQTFNATNAGPRVGPLVINEIHYNPAPGGDEFVELKNISGASVALFDSTNTWDLDGLGFDFPPSVSVAPNAFVLLIATNPAAFATKYSVPNDVLIFGPYAGNLQDSGERLELRRPDTADTNGVPRIVVDVVRYNDKAPWPPGADGSGASLQRLVSNAYGDDPTNWFAATPTPGRLNAEADSDGDGMPDSWEDANGTDRDTPDAGADPDGDGYTNLQEYLAGTNPQSAGSYLRWEFSETSGGDVGLVFNAASNRSFTVFYKTVLDGTPWVNVLTNVPPAPTNRAVRITTPANGTSQFYRLAAP